MNRDGGDRVWVNRIAFFVGDRIDRYSTFFDGFYGGPPFNDAAYFGVNRIFIGYAGFVMDLG
ncbi:MAG: hypothetical protein C7B45_17325 [Sulfobacillus acidophilus]|uniref:Uncharacterized protein n=1 Tax=Sulfobacillus acidophilus TaxID=53633 RepID=A0A2T2WCJ5_9FIRM|nr:MAG: hypothetical protein C7B45_17325 [Sulfobacillus acidophilus]